MRKLGIGRILRNIYRSESGRLQPVRLTARVLRCQLWRTFLRVPMRFRTVTGPKLTLVPGASDSISEFWYHQVPDFEELAFALHILNPGDLFVDVGANQGGWTIMVAGRGARVIAFEPIPPTVDRLYANVLANPEIAQQIEVRPIGLGDRYGNATFIADLDTGNRLVSNGEETNRKTITIHIEPDDDALRSVDPKFIKVDVEGAELAFLRGCRETLAKQHLCALVMETFRPANYSSPALIEAEAILRGFGFVPMAYHPWTRELTPLLNPYDGKQNTIYVRNPDSLSRSLKLATPLRVFGKDL